VIGDELGEQPGPQDHVEIRHLDQAGGAGREVGGDAPQGQVGARDVFEEVEDREAIEGALVEVGPGAVDETWRTCSPAAWRVHRGARVFDAEGVGAGLAEQARYSPRPQPTSSTLRPARPWSPIQRPNWSRRKARISGEMPAARITSRQ
jgi:hypothetical protein